MGAVDFSVSRELCAVLRGALRLEVFVETGTHEGDSLAKVADLFEELHSVELSARYYEAARARFHGNDRIALAHGTSPDFLRELRPRLGSRPTLYYLDAHWCVAEGTAGQTSQCPLVDEIAAIGTLGPDSVILIDDARLFLAPPLRPHDIADWPAFDVVHAALRRLSSDHAVMVLNDLIIFYPRRAHSALVAYARERGIDWLRAAQSVAENAALRASVEEKEGAIQDLHREASELIRQLHEREAVLKGLSEEISRLDTVLQESRAAPERTLGDAQASQAAPAVSEAAGDLQRALVEKEAVIRELSEALANYRRAFGIAGPLLPPARAVLGPLRNAARLMRPRLGVLNQHEALELRPPPGYTMATPASQAPRISIVTPSFRQAAFIERTLRSVLGQGYPNLEYRVQDGASEDGTREILERYSTELHGWDSSPDGGQAQAINRAFAHTGGEIMAWLNSDDLLMPGTLAYVADYFMRHPEVDVVYGHRILIDEDDREIGRWVLPPHDDKVLSWADFVPQETLFWRRRIWEKAGGRVDESFRFALDWDLLVRFRGAGARFARLPRFLGAFRIHEHQKTSAVINEVGFREMDRIRQRELGRVPSRTEIRAALAAYLGRHVLSDLAWRTRARLNAFRGKAYA